MDKVWTVKRRKTGRPLIDPLFEELRQFITKERQDNKFLSTKRFLAYAKRQAQMKNSPLKISWGWYRAFLKRHNFSMRKKTKPDSNQKEIDKFVEHFKQILSSG